MTSMMDVAVLAVLMMPLVLLVTQMPRVKKRPRMVVLAGCYVLLVADELVFWHVGMSYYYPHLLVGSLLVSVAAGSICVLERPADQRKQTMVPFYVLMVSLLVGVSAYAYLRPQTVETAAIVVALTVLVVNGIVLIRNMDDNAIPYLGIIALWFVRGVVAYQPWPLLQRVSGAGFTLALSGHIMYRARQTNAGLLSEREFLVKARDIILNMLYDISTSAQNLSSVDFTLTRVLEAITEGLAVEGAAVYIREERPGAAPRLHFGQSAGVFWTMQVHGEYRGGKTTFLSAELRKESYNLGEGLVGLAASKGEPIEMDRGHDRTEMRSLGLNPHNIRNVVAVPLKVKAVPLGVLVVQNRKHKSSFGPDDMRLLGVLAEQAAISINNARMYEELARADRIRQEMNIASEMQMQLLPKSVPAVGHLAIHPFIRPAKEVGGDYYDFIHVGTGGFAIVIGDVSGKGLPAGMIMVTAHTVLQIYARGRNDTKEVLTQCAREMYPRMRRGQFMTLNYLLWEDAERTLRYTAAGHEHILWFRRERGASERIRAGGVAVGLLEDLSTFVSETTLRMKPGDVFALYTDGVTEARNSVGEMFSLNRLQSALDRHAHLGDAAKISANIIGEVKEFTGEAEQYDDMTLLVGVVS